MIYWFLDEENCGLYFFLTFVIDVSPLFYRASMFIANKPRPITDKVQINQESTNGSKNMIM